MASLISIIIVAHNQIALTQRCIESIIRHTTIPYELILVDNGSTDGSLEYFLNLEAVVLHNAQNVSYAKALNMGIHAAKGDVLVFLNNDTVVTPNWLTNTICCLESNAQIGVVGPVSNYSHTTALPGSPNTAGPLMEQFAMAYNVSDPTKWYDLETFLPGFCLVMPSKVIMEVGGFQEQFEMGFYEDYDYCLRVKQAGYRVVCAGDTFVFHEGSATFKAEEIDTVTLAKENEKLFVKKWAPVQWGGVDIVIINFNSRDSLLNCLNHLQAYTPEEHRIYVIDNGSTDGSCEALKAYPDLTLVANSRNIGLVKARNQGILLGRGKYLVFLHPDVQVGPDWLKPLIQAADEDNSRVVVCGEQGASRRELGHQDDGYFDQLDPCFLVIRQSLVYVGMFDERFYIHRSLADFCSNARYQGYKTYLCNTGVTHLNAASPYAANILFNHLSSDRTSFQQKRDTIRQIQQVLMHAPMEIAPATRTLTVLIPVQDFVNSGGMRFLCHLANMLVERGHRVSFVVPRGASIPPVPLKAQVQYMDLVDPEELGLTKQKIPGARLTPVGGKVFNPASFPAADVIIANWFTTAHSVSLVAKGIPIHLIMGYEPDFFQQPELREVSLLARSTYHLKTRGMTISNWLRQKILHHHRKECSVISPGVDTRLFKPLPKTKKQQKTIMTVGSGDEIKGFHDFLRAMELVAQQQPEIELLIAAKTNLTVPTYLPYRLVHPPTEKEMAIYYNQADVFVSSSWSEGFGLPPLEAMACGVPVVVTDCGGVHEYGLHGVNCLMVPPRNPNALAQGVLTYLRDPDLCHYVVNLGLATVQNFSWTKTLWEFERNVLELVRPVRVSSAAAKHRVRIKSNRPKNLKKPPKRRKKIS